MIGGSAVDIEKILTENRHVMYGKLWFWRFGGFGGLSMEEFSCFAG